MSRDEKLHIVVAETSPIIGSGIVHCLRRLPGLQIQPVEVHSYADLTDCIKSSDPQIVIVNPTFEGSFDPSQLRNSTSDDIKILAIEVGVLDKRTRALYDGAISIVDDLNTLATKIAELSKEEDEMPGEKESLSQREKEIITLVVKGMTNKEIADRLFLSVHTVNTHRRNIARKLEIHSATGLTIYAIVNQLVDLSEIKL